MTQKEIEDKITTLKSSDHNQYFECDHKTLLKLFVKFYGYIPHSLDARYPVSLFGIPIKRSGISGLYLFTSSKDGVIKMDKICDYLLTE